MAGPAAAVSRPLELIFPTVVFQAKFGCLANTTPNWSSPVAVNCCVAPWTTETGDGVTVMLLRTDLTVTVTLLVVNSPPESVIVTWKA